jgi:hypothetical protein
MLTTAFFRQTTDSIEMNPYESPMDTSQSLDRAPEENPWGLVQRCGLYLATGLVLYVAFCSPLDFAFGNLFAHEWWVGTSLIPFTSLMVASLLAGLAFEPFLQMRAPTALIGPSYMLLNAILFCFLAVAFENLSRPMGFERFAGAALWSLFMAPFGCIFCIHLVGPICIGAIWLAGRTVEASPVSSKSS